VIVSNSVSEYEWDQFVERQPDASGYHLWRWRRVMTRAFGHETMYLAAREGEEIVGVLPTVLIKSWMFGRALVSLPFVNYGGVLAVGGDARRALVDAAASVAADARADHLELRHLVRHFEDLPVKQHKVTMRLRLAANEEQAWTSLDRKIRNQIKKAEKGGLTCETGGRELVADFYGVFAHNMRDLGTPVYGRVFFDAVLETFPTSARVFVVRLGRTPVAAAIAYAFRDTIEIPWASSLRSSRPLCANTLLYWHAVREAIAGGKAHFDFGRSTPGDGPFQFKRQWGAEPSTLAWEYRIFKGGVPNQNPSNPKYRSAIAVWKRLPVRLTTWIGPSIVRSIP
jgi:FemAB-related protein (PEP-CTERM system-associated)